MKQLLVETAGYSGKLRKTAVQGKLVTPCGVKNRAGKRHGEAAGWWGALLIICFAATVLACSGHIVPESKSTSHQRAYESKHESRHRPRHKIKYTPGTKDRPAADVEVRAKLEETWRTWRGTPHRLGGRDKRGIDCSGLVQVVYRELFGIFLPRTVAAQVKLGRQVSRRDLRPGDLVFFRPPGKYRHVGIYMGNQRFLHTSARYGVMVSRISDSYWKNCYWTARRHW